MRARLHPRGLPRPGHITGIIGSGRSDPSVRLSTMGDPKMPWARRAEAVIITAAVSPSLGLSWHTFDQLLTGRRWELPRVRPTLAMTRTVGVSRPYHLASKKGPRVPVDESRTSMRYLVSLFTTRLQPLVSSHTRYFKCGRERHPNHIRGHECPFRCGGGPRHQAAPGGPRLAHASRW